MPILIMCMALLAACSSPRKACRKADRHISRAVWLCPDVLQRDSVRVQVVVPGDSAIGELSYSQHEVDSLLAACAELERSHGHDIDVVTLPVPERVIVERFRSRVCAVAPVLDSTNTYRLRIWVDATGALQYRLTVFPLVVDLTEPCPPAVDRPADQPWAITVWPWPSWILIGIGISLWYRNRKLAHAKR